MNKALKTRQRDIIRKTIKQPTQTTLDKPYMSKKKTNSEKKKHIEITKIDTATKEEELALKIQFKLLPSKTYFSRITSELHFDGQQLKLFCISIPQSPLANDEFEFTSVLGMKGISRGFHTIKFEMYELWATEKLNFTSKEITIEYVPINREDRLIKIPIVKSIAGTDLAIVSDSDKELYREIEESKKKELTSKRDKW